MNFTNKDSISFDIQISVQSLPEGQRSINILDVKSLDTSHYSSFVNGRIGISASLEITFGTMKFATNTEYLGSILSWCLESIFSVFAGRHYIGWSQTMYSTYRVVFDSYNKIIDNSLVVNQEWLIIYLADVGEESFKTMTEHEKYRCFMFPITPCEYLEDGYIENSDYQKVVIVPKREFYKIVYEKMVEIKNIFDSVGDIATIRILQEILPLAEAHLLYYNVDINPKFWQKHF